MSVVTLAATFMNNVGALALLMPLAFGSLLGGLPALIGTPSNEASACGGVTA
jgi:hypothetical protein